MQTPVLSKKQQNSTLSAKKNKNKEIIRNVFTTPYNIQYWPEVTNEDYLILKKTLEDNLPRIRPLKSKVKIPWEKLKFATREERKQIRLKFIKKLENGKETVCDNKGLFLGINDVTRCLENCSLAAVLITNEVQPKLMVQHVIDQCVLNKTPILMFKDLRILIQHCCGFPSVALGISKELSSSSKLHIINNCIHELSEHYPVPQDHINYDRSLKSENQPDIPESDFNSGKGINVDQKKTKIDVESTRKQYYLLRESPHKRIFFPQDAAESFRKIEMNYQFLENIQNEKKNVPYKPLKIKRIKGDSSRKNESCSF